MGLISLIIGIIGTIITILSAIYSYNQAEKAAKSALDAENMKKSIEREYRKIELGKLLNSIKTIIDQTIILTTPANPEKKIRGLNYDHIVSLLRTFINNLKENCHYLPNDKEELTIIQYKQLENYILELVREKEQEKKYEIGDKLHNCIGEILRIVKPETDIT